jgi:hypothetical protein
MEPRAELTDDDTSMTAANDLAVLRAVEAAGIELIDENGGRPGVRLRKPPKPLRSELFGSAEVGSPTLLQTTLMTYRHS